MLMTSSAPRTAPVVAAAAAAQSLHVLIVGYGRAGSAILQALVAQPQHFRLSLLVRPTSLSNPTPLLQSLRQQGVVLVSGDVTDDRATLTTLLRGVDALVSAIGGELMEAQVELARAAVEAGVKRFVPAEFGADLLRIVQGSELGSISLLHNKIAARAAIIATGVPYTLIQCSVWTELLFAENGIIDVAQRVIHVPGSLDRRFSTTTLSDFGSLTAAILLDANTINDDCHIASDTLTWAQLADALERVTGGKWERKTHSVQELVVAMHKNPADSRARMMLMMVETVAACCWSDEETWNFRHFECGVRVTKLEEFVRRKYETIVFS